MQLFDPIMADLRDEQGPRGGAVDVDLVRAWMTSPVFVCAASGTAAEALRRMQDHDVSALPVLDEQQRVVGVVTDRDVAMAVLASGRLPASLPVRELAVGPALTVGCEEPMSRALELMRVHHARRIAVVDDEGHPVGVLCRSDLIRAALGGARGLEGTEVVRVAGGLSRRPLG